MHNNHLINETSVYLLQHAHNPVNWYPWCDEALKKAMAEDKPILVSIGYAACHWCHVMERESFEDEATAKLMNEFFINIKIDREERPDLDHIYMDAVQAMSGSGGWPLTVFLTPQGKPFYGGTYFPPIAAHNRMSWKDTITAVHKAYRERKNEIVSQAENLTEHLIKANSFGIDKSNQTQSASVFSEEKLNEIADNILKQADKEWGGFGNAPKFPQTFSIQFLLRHYHFTKNENALLQALLSLDKMIDGGIYDQLGGGFARYSTDKKWLAPHFEKMLYDNALLISVLSEAYQLTKKEKYVSVIKQTMQFIQREMMNDEYGFYSALDADSEGVEGKFYTWSKKEIDEILKEDANLFCTLFDVSENGNWEHTNILWMPESIENFAVRKKIEIKELQLIIRQCKEKLFNKRTERIRPQLDDKILLGWNALMNVACSKAYAASGNDKYKELAICNMQFIEEKMQKESDSFYHTYKNQVARIDAFLDDYAYLIQSYIHLQEITGNGDYLIKAKNITTFVIENFSETETGFFYYTHQQQQDVIVRKKEVYDGATPSGNAVMALNLYYLSIVFDIPDWHQRSLKMCESLSNAIIKYPTSFGCWASAFQINFYGTKEIAVVGNGAEQYLPAILKNYLPNKILQSTNVKNSIFPLFKGKFNEEMLSFYVCKNYICSRPVYEVGEFLQICNT
jgi:hypothetical protein